MLKALRNDDDMHKATNGLRVMVGDKQKDAADMIICKTDMDKKHLEKMREADWFEYDPEYDVELQLEAVPRRSSRCARGGGGGGGG